MNYHKNKCFTLGSHLSEPKFAKVWQILPKITLTLSIGQNSIDMFFILKINKKLERGPGLVSDVLMQM